MTSIDPGRSVIFTAASSNGKDEYSIKRVTRKEYNTYSGSRRITKEEEERASAEGVLSLIMNKPTTKTVNFLKYLTYARHIKENLQELFEFHRSESAKNNLKRYQDV